MSHACHRFWKCYTFSKVHNPLRLQRETTSERPKVLRTRQFFALLTSKCASRHNSVHFFDILTSKSGPELLCFVHFDFNMCFAPQRRAIFSLIWPDGSAPAALASLLFDPPEPQIIGQKHSVSRLSPPFRASASSFFWLSLLWSALFYSSLLSASAHLCFSSVHIVGSLTSKLPSIIGSY